MKSSLSSKINVTSCGYSWSEVETLKRNNREILQHDLVLVTLLCDSCLLL